MQFIAIYLCLVTIRYECIAGNGYGNKGKLFGNSASIRININNISYSDKLRLTEYVVGRLKILKISSLKRPRINRVYDNSYRIWKSENYNKRCSCLRIYKYNGVNKVVSLHLTLNDGVNVEELYFINYRYRWSSVLGEKFNYIKYQCLIGKYNEYEILLSNDYYVSVDVNSKSRGDGYNMFFIDKRNITKYEYVPNEYYIIAEILDGQNVIWSYGGMNCNVRCIVYYDKRSNNLILGEISINKGSNFVQIYYKKIEGRWTIVGEDEFNKNLITIESYSWYHTFGFRNVNKGRTTTISDTITLNVDVREEVDGMKMYVLNGINSYSCDFIIEDGYKLDAVIDFSTVLWKSINSIECSRVTIILKDEEISFIILYATEIYGYNYIYLIKRNDRYVKVDYLKFISLYEEMEGGESTDTDISSVQENNSMVNPQIAHYIPSHKTSKNYMGIYIDITLTNDNKLYWVRTIDDGEVMKIDYYPRNGYEFIKIFDDNLLIWDFENNSSCYKINLTIFKILNILLIHLYINNNNDIHLERIHWKWYQINHIYYRNKLNHT